MKTNTARFVRLCFLSLTLILSATAVFSQATKDTEATKAEEFSVGSLRLVDIGAQHYIRVHFTNRQDDTVNDASPNNIRITFLPSGKTIPTTEILAAQTQFIGGWNQQRLDIVLTNDPATKPMPGDTQVQVTFNEVHFRNSAADPQVTRTDVTGVGPIFDATNIDDLVDASLEALKDAVASAKTTDEKNIFMGLNIIVPSGEGNDTEGSGDIIINRNLQSLPFGQGLFDQINFGLKIKKASENKADPRHFETGLTFRKTFLINRSKIRLVADALNQTPRGSQNLAMTSTDVRLKNGIDSKRPEQIINDLQQNFFRGLVFDNGLNFEGDVDGMSIGNVSNLLYSSQLQVTAVARAIGKQKGFWTFRWLPVGVEAGYNLKNEDDPNNEKHSLARLKTGGVLTLFYEANNPADFLNRVEFETQAVNRYLFKRETLFDAATQKNLLVEKGNKYWLQADLKFMLGAKIGPGRIGFRASFQRGSLPPVYAFTKVFNFSVIFESLDDDTSREIKIR
jgi:hypothetical protein